MDLEQLGSGGPNPCGDSVKKSTHFLSLINGWIWSNWGHPCGDSVKENEYSFS